MLCASIVQETLTHSNANTAVAYYYCDYKSATTQNPQNILGSLAKRLAVQDENEESFSKLQAFYQNLHPKSRPPIEFDIMELRDLVVGMAANFNEVMIIVDALDEGALKSK